MTAALLEPGWFAWLVWMALLCIVVVIIYNLLP